MCQTTCQASRQNMSQEKCRDACPNECQSALRINVRISEHFDTRYHNRCHRTWFFAGGIFTLLITYSTFLYFLVVVTIFKFQWNEHSPMGRRDEQALIQRHGSVVAHPTEDTWILPVPPPSFSTLSLDLPRSYVAMSKADAGSCERSIRGFQDRGGHVFFPETDRTETDRKLLQLWTQWASSSRSKGFLQIFHQSTEIDWRQSPSLYQKVHCSLWSFQHLSTTTFGGCGLAPAASWMPLRRSLAPTRSSF